MKLFTAPALLLAALAALQAGNAPQPAAKPNIIFFLVDDMGWQETSVPFHTGLTALNRRYRTPNLERLAAQGMKFTQAYASAVYYLNGIGPSTGSPDPWRSLPCRHSCAMPGIGPSTLARPISAPRTRRARILGISGST